MIPISLRPVISKTARDRDSVLTGYHLPPQAYIKAVKKFTWRIYALSEHLLVHTCTVSQTHTHTHTQRETERENVTDATDHPIPPMNAE